MYALVLAACCCTMTVNVDTNTDVGIFLNEIQVQPGTPTLIPVINGKVDLKIRFIDGGNVEERWGSIGDIEPGGKYRLKIEIEANPPTVASA